MKIKYLEERLDAAFDFDSLDLAFGKENAYDSTS